MKLTKGKIGSIVKEYLIITFGILLVAIGAHFFKFPNAISTGGVTGIAVVLHQIIPFLSATNIVTILNVVLIIIGFIFLGKDFGIKTVYGSIILSVMLEILDVVVPMSAPLTNEPFLEMIYAVAFPAAGSAILFYSGGSSGGTDIVAMIVRKWVNLDSGKALLATDIIFVLLTFYNFETRSLSMLTGLLSLLGLLLKSLVVDNLLESLNQSKKFLVITSHRDVVEEFIKNDLNRSTTTWECEGSYTHTRAYAMISVMNRYQAFRLRSFIKKVDPQAFIIITSTSDIIGKGFREI
ncbi:MAG: YitT family protein [Ruminococcaceae bacterium]|nr:YitT family protein [Oscillospiraceae bacterium]